MRTTIHPTAIVHHRAELDDGVEVGPYCVIGEGCRIGADTVLHNHVTVQGPTTIGRENVVFPYSVVGAEPQDLKFEGHHTELVIGDRTKIREHATIHRGTELGGAKTVIGSDCLIMVGVHIAHDCVVEDRVVIANNCMIGGHCLIEEGAALGGGVGIHHFTTIGTLSFVGGLARVSKDVPPYVVVEGSPAEPRKINTTALMRERWPTDELERLRSAFKRIFRTSDVPAQVAVEQLREGESASAAVLKLCDFVERAQLGTHGRYLESTRQDR